MPELDRRPPLTPEAARDTPLRTLLERIDAFKARNPGCRISAPYCNFSRKWEVSVDGEGTALYDNGFRMIDILETRDPE